MSPWGSESNMTNTLILTCHTCGSRLEVAPEIERFACAHCGSEWVVRRSGGVVALASAAEETASRSRVAELRSEIEDLQEDLWQRREDIPQMAVYNFFVLLDQVLHQRRGTKRKRFAIFGSRILSKEDQAQWEEDVKQTLFTLTADELETLIEQCEALIKDKVPMQHYVMQLQRLRQLKSELRALNA
jgi:predicted RNA-binding Zn-ribbon protein involved in translation (DUF1610 family)